MTASVTALDFDFVVVDGDDDETNVDAYYNSFSFDYGAHSAADIAPVAVPSRGQLLLNDDGTLFTYDKLNNYKKLIVKSSGYTYFDLAIVDRDIDIENEIVTLTVAGHSSSRREEAVSYTNQPAGSAGTPTDKEIIALYYPEASFGRMWGLKIPGKYLTASGRPARALEFTRESLMRTLATSTLTLFLERCNRDKADLFVTRMPLDITALAGATFNPGNTAMAKRGYREARSDKWQANQWEVAVADTAFEIKTTRSGGRSVARRRSSLRANTNYNIRTGYSWGSMNQSAPNYFDSVNEDNWGGFVDIGKVIGPGRTASSGYTWTIGHSTDGVNHDYLLWHGWRRLNSSKYFTVPLPSGVKYYKKKKASDRENILILTDEDTASKRVLPLNLINLLYEGVDDGTNYAAVRSAVDAWAQWEAHLLNVALIPDGLREGEARSIPQRRPGDVVNMTVGNIDHRCMIIRVRWQLQGVKPLTVTWNLVTLGPRPQAAPSSANYVTLNGEQVLMNGEPVALAS